MNSRSSWSGKVSFVDLLSKLVGLGMNGEYLV